jgi:hypothetical protein
MTGFTDRVSQGILNHVTGKSALFSIPTAHVGLFTGVGIDAGTGFTEVSGTGYARVATAAADWNAATGSGPSSIVNANPIAFPIPTAAWGTAIGMGIFDALTTGNLLAWDFLGNYLWFPATVSSGTPAIITSPAHGYLAGDTVQWTIEYGGTNPTFAVGSFTGPLIVGGSPLTNSFTVTNGGVGVNTSAPGNGMVRKVVPQIISAGVLVSFPAGSLNIRSS